MVQRPSGTVTFCLTDVVGSTQLWEQDRAAMADALQRHDDLVRAVVADTGGLVFSTAGDSFAVAYTDAAAAVDAALRIRQRLGEPGSVGLGVRIGLNTGTAVERGGNYFGPVLNRCARIMALGGAGDIFLSAATAELLDGVELFDVGRHQLRGVDAPQRLFGLRRADGDPPGAPDAGDVRISASVGGRRGEVGALRWTNIDLDAGDLVISKALVERSADRSILEKDTKSHQNRRVALDAGTVDALRSWRVSMERRAEIGLVTLAPTAYVFSPSLDGSLP